MWCPVSCDNVWDRSARLVGSLVGRCMIAAVGVSIGVESGECVAVVTASFCTVCSRTGFSGERTGSSRIAICIYAPGSSILKRATGVPRRKIISAPEALKMCILSEFCRRRKMTVLLKRPRSASDCMEDVSPQESGISGLLIVHCGRSGLRTGTMTSCPRGTRIDLAAYRTDAGILRFWSEAVKGNSILWSETVIVMVWRL